HKPAPLPYTTLFRSESTTARRRPRRGPAARRTGLIPAAPREQPREQRRSGAPLSSRARHQYGSAMAAFRSLGVTGLALGAGLLLSALASAQDHAPPAAVGQTAPLPAGVPTTAPTSTIPIRPPSELDRFDGAASGVPSPAAEEPF